MPIVEQLRSEPPALVRPRRVVERGGGTWIWVAPLAVTILAVLLGLVERSAIRDSTTSELFLPLAFIATTIALVLRNVLLTGRGVDIDITRPLGFYSLFYLLYVPVPYFMLLLLGVLSYERRTQVAALILIAYLAWSVGAQAVARAFRARVSVQVPRLDGWLLYWLCLAAIGLVTWAYVWRQMHGVFYTQSKFYAQELSATAAFREVFGSQLQLPVILLLGLLATQRDAILARVARRTLFIYSACLFVVTILASETRLSITTLVFLVAAIRLYRPAGVKRRYLVLAGALAFAGLVVIQGVRVVIAADFAAAEDQAGFALKRGIPAIFSALSGGGGVGEQITQRSVARAGGGVTFLTSVIIATEDRGSFVGDDAILSSMWSLIPRALWPSKPSVTPPQIALEERLGMPLYDAGVIGITEFYATGGTLLVILGYISFSIAVSLLARRCSTSTGFGWWIILIFWLSYLAQVEQEMVVGALGVLRNAVLFLCAYKVLTEIKKALLTGSHSRLEQSGSVRGRAG